MYYRMRVYNMKCFTKVSKNRNTEINECITGSNFLKYDLDYILNTENNGDN